MRFSFTDDQRGFADALRSMLAARCTTERVRAAWDAPDGRIEGLWGELAEMGVVGLAAPSGTGGMGLDDVDLVLLLAEAGRVALPEPLADVAAVAIPTIRDHARTASIGESDAEMVLGALCDGSATVAVGLGWDATVESAAGAHWFLLEAHDGLHLVERDVVDIRPVGSVDGSRRLSRVVWTPSDATRLSNPARAAAQARDRAALAAAAELCGLSDAMLAMTVGYVAERRQFGVPIGSFQAVKHHLADALLAVEFAKPLVWRAAYSLSLEDRDASIHVSMAKAAASDAAETVGAAALQCHGAIAYTVEYDLHLFMKRAWALARRSGTAARHRSRVAAAVL